MAENQGTENTAETTTTEANQDSSTETTFTQTQFDEMTAKFETQITELSTAVNGLKDNNAALVKERRDDETKVRNAKTEKATSEKDFLALQELHNEKITALETDLTEKSKNDSLVEQQQKAIESFQVTLKGILDGELSTLSNDQKNLLESMPGYNNGSIQEKAAAIKWFKTSNGISAGTPGGVNGGNQTAGTSFMEAFKKGDQKAMNAAMNI